MNADNPNLKNPLSHSSHAPLVYVMGGDHAAGLISHATNYRMHVLCGIEALQEQVELQAPDAIVVNIEPDGKRIAEFTAHCAEALHIPVIFLGEKSDVEARLAAVRAGAAHYFVKPVKPEQVIARLDGVTCKPCDNPYHIMLIDEDKAHLALLTRHLSEAGLRVTAIGNCRDALDRMSRCRPELIALDADLTGITSSEFAAIIRQMEEYDPNSHRLPGFGKCFQDTQNLSISTHGRFPRQSPSCQTAGSGIADENGLCAQPA